MSRARILTVLGVLAVITVFALLLGKDKQTATNVDSKSTVHVSKQVEKSCMSCHAVDENGKLARIEYVRKSPEGWAQTIARMERIHGVKLTDEEREQIIKDLSRERGLAPKEAEKVQYWMANKPSYAEANPKNENVVNGCISCHAAGRFVAQRRTAEEWKNLKDFHLVMFPSIYLNNRHLDWPVVADAALEYLAKEYPLDSQEWNDWKGKQYDVEGKWKVVGFQGTKGFYIGESEFKKKDNGYSENKNIRFLKDQSSKSVQGDVRMYSGFMLRSHYSEGERKLNGTYNVLENGNVIKGDWSQKNDLGITGEETYYKVQTEKPEIIHMEPRALKKGTTNQVTLYGMNLNKLKAEDLKLPNGVTAAKLTVNSDEQAQLELKVEAGAETGTFAVAGQQAIIHGGIVVYDNIDNLKISPSYAVARMGGAGPMDKVSTQFVAYAYSNGKDGKPDTEDDLMIGPVDAEWSMEGANDEDLKYMGTLDKNGLYTPREEGVNKERKYTQENVGTATVTAKTTVDGKVLSAQAHLVSTVPDYNNLVQ